MADIKTRDAVKGTIKTLDKAAIAGYARVECVLKTGCGTDCRVNFTIFRVFL